MTVASVVFEWPSRPGSRTFDSHRVIPYIQVSAHASSNPVSEVMMSLPQNLGVRRRSFQSCGKVREPRRQRGSMLACAAWRTFDTEVDLDVDQPAVKVALARQFDEHVGVTGVDGLEATAPVSGDELDDVGFSGVPFENQGPENGRSRSVRGPD